MVKPEIQRHIDMYHQRGWNIVPTVQRPSGIYMACSWTEWQSKRQSHEDVMKLFEEHEHDGIAIITGKVSNLAVIDVDLKKGADPAEWAAKYFNAPIVETPSGGIHIYCQWREGIANRVNVVDGVDIRGEGGLVFAPPCFKGNIPYNWMTFSNEPIVFPNLDERREEAEDRIKEVEEFMSAKVKEGGRNQHIARCAGYLYAQGLAEDIVLTLVRGINNTNVSPPLPDAELRTTVNSIIRTHKRKTAIQQSMSSVPIEMNVGNAAFSLLAYEDFMVKFGEHNVEWIVPKWMPDATMLFLVSPPECYKTWLELDLAVSIASGLPFLGKYEMNQDKVGPVMVIQQEDFAGQTAQRLALIHRSKVLSKEESSIRYDEDGSIYDVQIPMLKHLPIHLHTEAKLSLDDTAVVDGLAAAIRKLRPRAVIIDPLYSVVGADNYMAAAPKKMMIFKKLRDEVGCSFVFAHHSGKVKKDKDGKILDDADRQNMWGSQLLNGFIESGWQIRKKGDGVVEIHKHFKAAKAEGPKTYTFNINTEGGNFLYEVAEGNVVATTESENTPQADLFAEEEQRRAAEKRKTINPQFGPNRTTPDDLMQKPDGLFAVPQYGKRIDELIMQYRTYIPRVEAGEPLPFTEAGIVYQLMFATNNRLPLGEFRIMWESIPKEKILQVCRGLEKANIVKIDDDCAELTSDFKGLI